MDWLLVTPQLHSTFSLLGSLEGDSYVVSPNALAILEEINYKLTYEDQTLRTFRRAIGFGQNMRADLIPLLGNTKDEEVLDSVIRVLVNMTVPVECLFSVDVMYRTEVGRHTIFELNKLLYTSKEAFTDPKITKSIVEYMKHILESDSKLSPPKCDQINNCLLLLRNILHIPEANDSFLMHTNHNQANGTQMASMQNAILWNLFIQSIDKVLLSLMICPQRSCWGATVVQLIALMYKDQHVSTLEKLLHMGFEATISESSGDNESNTSPPKLDSGGSSPTLTSDPTSDSSDNGSGGLKTGTEDHRLEQREETDANLEEVSRKAYEYDSFIVDKPKAACDVRFPESEEQANAYAAAVAMICISDPSNMVLQTVAMKTQDDKNDIKPSTKELLEIITQQPADLVTNTAKHAIIIVGAKEEEEEEEDEEEELDDVFMPPPPLPVKDNIKPINKNSSSEEVGEDSLDAPHEASQKVPHRGQINLLKDKGSAQKRACPSSQSEQSDCGYGTQVENQESISTSSNDDDGPQAKPQHQKPPCRSRARSKARAVITLLDKKELRRKKLVKRGKSSLINVKCLAQHTPTDEDISNLLKEFTVDFLLKGYGPLVEDLHSQLLANLKVPIDTSHFFWVVTYFLKCACQLELDIEHINSILTYDVISYLTYEGVMLSEQIELNARHEGTDLKPGLTRMHLVVTTIREILQTIDTYKKMAHITDDDCEYLRRLEIQISSTTDLRCLFVLLLRLFNPNIHSKQYLQDLVITNHTLLLVLDSVNSDEDNDVSFDMVEHLSQFATKEIMYSYGLLLEDYNNNSDFLNDCIFTMMHHVAGDLGEMSTLFQPIILKTFARIWETGYDLSIHWSDLTHYVMQKFVNSPQKSPLAMTPTSLTQLTKTHNMEHTVGAWTQEEMDTLYWYYVQSKKSHDIVGKIAKLFNNNGNKQKSRISIIQQLLEQDIITLIEYDDLMKFEDAEYQRTLISAPSSDTTESGIDMRGSSTKRKPSDDVQILRDLIIKENKEKHLVWLQQLLLECCYVKMILRKSSLRKDHQDLEFIMESVPYHCILKHKSIPVVPWNSEQSATKLYQPFVLLLHKLGFQLPADAGPIFSCIPDFWTAELMFSLVKKLGPLDKLLIKFNTNELELSPELVLASVSRLHQAGEARASFSSFSSFETTDSIGLTTTSEADTRSEETNSAETFAVPKARNYNSNISFMPEMMSTPSLPNWLQLVMRSKYNSNPQSQAQLPKQGATENNPDADIYMSKTNAKPAFIITAVTTPTQAATVSSFSTLSTHPTASTSLPVSALSCASIINQNVSNNERTFASNFSHSRLSNNNIKNIKSHENYNNETASTVSSETPTLVPHEQQDEAAFESLASNDVDESGFLTSGATGNLESLYCAIIASAYEEQKANECPDLTCMYVSDEEEE